MPPPPVAGAAVGGLLAAGLGVADADGVGVTAGDAGGLALALAPVLALALAPAVPLAETAGVGELVPGENEGEGVPAEHAETAAETRMVTVLQPATASLALSPARVMAARTFIKPPHASGGERPTRAGYRRPPPASENATGPRRAARRQPPRERRLPGRQGPWTARKRND